MFKESTPRSRIIVLIIVLLSLAISIPLIIWIEKNLSDETMEKVHLIAKIVGLILLSICYYLLDKSKKFNENKKSKAPLDPKNHLPS